MCVALSFWLVAKNGNNTEARGASSTGRKPSAAAHTHSQNNFFLIIFLFRSVSHSANVFVRIVYVPMHRCPRCCVLHTPNVQDVLLGSVNRRLSVSVCVWMGSQFTLRYVLVSNALFIPIETWIWANFYFYRRIAFQMFSKFFWY